MNERDLMLLGTRHRFSLDEQTSIDASIVPYVSDRIVSRREGQSDWLRYLACQ
jgi:hypothetical protein